MAEGESDSLVTTVAARGSLRTGFDELALVPVTPEHEPEADSTDEHREGQDCVVRDGEEDNRGEEAESDEFQSRP